MKCKYCGRNNPFGSRYCEKCGQKLQSKTSKGRIGRSISDMVYVPNKKPSLLKNILLGLLVLFLIIFGLYVLGNVPEEGADTPTTQNLSNQSDKFVSAEHGFKISFPEYPTTQRIPTDSINGVTYSGTQYYYSTPDDQNVYMVQSWDYDIAPENFDNKTGLEGSINGMVGESGYSINDSILTSFKGYDAIEFNGFFEKDYYVKGMGFVRDDLPKVKFYLVLIVSSEYANFEKSFDNFISSFELTR